MACQSDKATYERLSQQAAVARLQVWNDGQAQLRHLPVCPDLVKLPTDVYADSCNKRVLDHQTDLALKERALNKFMGNK